MIEKSGMKSRGLQRKKHIIKQLRFKCIVFLLIFIAFLIIFTFNASAATWSVDTQTHWNNNEDSSYNITVNTTGLFLDMINWQTLYSHAAEEDNSFTSWATEDTFNLDTSVYDLVFFLVDIKNGGGGETQCRLDRTNGGVTSSVTTTSTSYVSKNISVSTGNWGNTDLELRTTSFNKIAFCKNMYIKSANYSNNGLWNSSWHDWTSTYVVNNITFDIDSLGGGLTYNLQVSDDGISVKDETGWTSILATGSVVHNPSLDSARYIRIRYNLTRSSTPLIDGFVVSASANATPTVDSSVPSAGTNGVVNTLNYVNVTISDAEGDTFNWSIETSPNIGSNSSNNDNNGTKECPVSGLGNGTTYTVYVNITDIAGNVLNHSFTFTTFGLVEFWCYNESNPNIGISPFEIEISNQAGTEVYYNSSFTNGNNISFSQLPTGDDVVFVVSADDFETRIYTYDISGISNFNYSFYLPPERNDYILKSNSTAVTDPTSNVVINLECQPGFIVSVQGWNESLYGHWFDIPEANYTLSGTSLTVSSDMLDSNTSLVRVQYYCDDNVLDYIIHIRDEVNTPVDDARINVSIIVNSVYVSATSVLTDGNGDATVYLIPDQHYKIKITKTGYVDEIADYIPSENIRTKTFMLEFEEVTPQIPDNPAEHITFNGYRSGSTIYINYSDATSHTINSTIYVFEINHSTNNTTSVGSFNHLVVHSYQDSISINSSNTHHIVLYYNHSYFGFQTMSFIVYGVINPVTNQTSTEDKFVNIWGDNYFGWSNFFMWIFVVGVFYYSDTRDRGIVMVFLGFILLFVNTYLGFNTVLSVVAGGVIPILLIIVGIGIMYITGRRM